MGSDFACFRLSFFLEVFSVLFCSRGEHGASLPGSFLTTLFITMPPVLSRLASNSFHLASTFFTNLP